LLETARPDGHFLRSRRLTGMLHTVARQQELRLRLLCALYERFVRDPNAYWELTKLDVQSAPNLARSTLEDDAPPDFSAAPPSAEEVRAAAFYLLEREFISALDLDAMRAQGLEETAVMLRVTANGTDTLEGFVLGLHAQTSERRIGFSTVEAAPSPAPGMPLARGGRS
jgi:hypothetical protein